MYFKKNIHRKPALIIGLAITLLLLLCALPAAHADEQQATAGQSGELTGKRLVDIHCTRCHLAPLPTDLPKENWPAAVHWMGNYVGMKGDEFDDLRVETVDTDTLLNTSDDYTTSYTLVDLQGNRQSIRLQKNWILTTPLMSKAEWLRIRQYFEANSRPKAEMKIRRPKPPVMKGFAATVPPLDLAPNGLIFSTKVDEAQQTLYVGRGVTDDWIASATGIEGEEGSDDILAFDLKSGKRVGYAKVSTDPMFMELTDKGIRVSNHGEYPIDHGNGQGQVIDWEGLDKGQPRARVLMDGLHRITEHHTHDLNGDGLDDIVVTGFGDGMLHTAGGFISIYWQTPEYAKLWQNAASEISGKGPRLLKGALRESSLSNLAGMMGAEIADFNNDGLPDILVIRAQADQQVLLFVNKGNESFERHVVVENTPSFGGISLEIADFNKDGHMDFILTNGNNVELVTDRPQHGIRVFQNNGDLSFSQRYWYPMHGSIRSVINDFDGDGDLDIASVSLVPDWDLDEPQSFVYLENKGNWQFTDVSLESAHWGIWTSIEAADVNGDQKTDIVLGSGIIPGVIPEDWKAKKIMEGRDGTVPSILFLINKN